MEQRRILTAKPKGSLTGQGVIHYEPYRNPTLKKREDRVAYDFYKFVMDDLDLSQFRVTPTADDVVAQQRIALFDAYAAGDVVDAQLACRFLARALLACKGGGKFRDKLEQMSRYRNQYHYWAVATVDLDLASYYRWFVDRELLNMTGVEGLGLLAPSHVPHITITRGVNDLIDVPREERHALWGKYEGQQIEFTYEPDIRFTGDTTGDRKALHWFIVVQAPMLKQIRDEFDIPSNWNLHLTIGKFNDTWAKEPQDPRLQTLKWKGR
jgi:hypothetical protein